MSHNIPLISLLLCLGASSTRDRFGRDRHSDRGSSTLKRIENTCVIIIVVNTTIPYKSVPLRTQSLRNDQDFCVLGRNEHHKWYAEWLQPWDRLHTLSLQLEWVMRWRFWVGRELTSYRYCCRHLSVIVHVEPKWIWPADVDTRWVMYPPFYVLQQDLCFIFLKQVVVRTI